MSATTKDQVLLSYFLDPELRQRAPLDGSGKNVALKFGIAVQGRPVRQQLYVRNDIDYYLDLTPFTGDPDLHITNYPSRLAPHESGPVEITFSPPPDRIKPLQASWDFKKVVLA